MFQPIFHYYSKYKQIGLVRFCKAVNARLKKHFLMQKISQRNAPIITPFFRRLPYLDSIVMPQKQLVAHANQYVTNQFSFLGSRAACYLAMPWYDDVRLEQCNCVNAALMTPSVRPELVEGFIIFQKKNDIFLFLSTFFIQSFETLRQAQGERGEDNKYWVKPGGKNNSNQDAFDIKVPWECARFQYALILAYAYVQTSNAHYLTMLKKQIISFIDAAPFMHGIHWSNPMEAAIRATNWIIAYQLVQKEFQSDIAFHDQLVHSLWQHMQFIETHWEIYDGRTNNHYLSNLVGYAYLCWFFNDTKRWKKCWKELQSEFAWQIQDDGSSYEGSTAYHGFVAELFLHGFLVAQQMGETITPTIQVQLKKMLQFADDTKNLCIGDDDSGSLLHKGLYDLSALASRLVIVPRYAKREIMIYKQFGLSIINHTAWNISLRHHAYHGRQPSAHFHEDVSSVTLSYQGIPILVDPGTYLYTGSKKWRNYFRSAGQHSTFYPVGWNQKTNDLFELAIAESNATITQQHSSIKSAHDLYGFSVSRTVSWSDENVTIQDDIRHATSAMEWQFIFAPGIELQKAGNGNWNIMHNSKTILQFQSTQLVFEKRKAWVSPSYGVKKESWALQAHGDCYESLMQFIAVEANK